VSREIALDDIGDGPPLVLIRGVGSRTVWRRVAPALGRRRRVVAPDLPGFGESPAIGERFDLSVTANALAERLADLVGEPFELLGNSLGAGGRESRRPRA
jgi:pimeloyl-ACP methyl ester carboxylesterase